MKYLLKSMQMARSTYYFELSKVTDQVAVRTIASAMKSKTFSHSIKAAMVCEEYIRN